MSISFAIRVAVFLDVFLLVSIFRLPIGPTGKAALVICAVLINIALLVPPLIRDASEH